MAGNSIKNKKKYEALKRKGMSKTRAAKISNSGSEGSRKGGKRSLRQLLYSTRFRLTLWYTIILALVLLVFSSIVYEAVKNDLNNATYTSLRSRLIQVASTYNPQTGKLSLAFDGGVSPPSVSGRETVQNKLA